MNSFVLIINSLKPLRMTFQELQKTVLSHLSENAQLEVFDYLKIIGDYDDKSINRAISLQKILTEDAELLKKLAQ